MYTHNKMAMQYWKILTEDLTHHGFQYKEGLNVDTIPFNPTGECSPGGLYFADTYNILLFLSYGTKIARVTFPEDAQVYREIYKSKADKIILSDIVKIKNWCMWKDPDVMKAMYHIAARDEWSLLDVRTWVPRDAYVTLCFEIVKRIGLALRDVDVGIIGQQPKTVKKRVQKRRLKLVYSDLCLQAVTQDGRALQYVDKDLTKARYTEICLKAVKQDGNALQYVDPEAMPESDYVTVCLEAVKKTGDSLRYVKEYVVGVYYRQIRLASTPTLESIFRWL